MNARLELESLPEIVKRLWEDDKAGSLSNEAARAIEKLQYNNDQMLSQIAWLLERVVVKEGNITLPCYQLSSREILNSMKELKRVSTTS